MEQTVANEKRGLLRDYVVCSLAGVGKVESASARPPFEVEASSTPTHRDWLCCSNELTACWSLADGHALRMMPELVDMRVVLH